MTGCAGGAGVGGTVVIEGVVSTTWVGAGVGVTVG